MGLANARPCIVWPVAGFDHEPSVFRVLHKGRHSVSTLGTTRV